MTKTLAQLNKQFAFMKRAGAKLDAFIQDTALDTLAHYAAHRNVTVVNDFYNHMPKGSRQAAMAEYILTFFAVSANDGKDKKDKPFINNPDKVNDDIGAREVNWFDLKKSPTPDQLFDLQAAVRAILKKAGKASCVIGTDGMLKAIAQAAGLPDSDVPTMVKRADSVEQAKELLANAEKADAEKADAEKADAGN